jgi:hypothetical protein
LIGPSLLFYIYIYNPKLWRLLKIQVSIGGWSALSPIVAPLEVQAKGEKLLGKAKGIKVWCYLGTWGTPWEPPQPFFIKEDTRGLMMA